MTIFPQNLLKEIQKFTFICNFLCTSTYIRHYLAIIDDQASHITRTQFLAAEWRMLCENDLRRDFQRMSYNLSKIVRAKQSFTF